MISPNRRQRKLQQSQLTSMWVWTGPDWMRPGGRFAKVMWLVSLPVAAFLIWLGWAEVGAGDTGGGAAFLVAWTVGIVAIEAWNFRTLYLGRGRQREAFDRARNEKDPR
jgi:hypothetical protein